MAESAAAVIEPVVAPVAPAAPAAVPVAAAPEPAKPAEPKTVLDAPAGEPKLSPSDWPEDWREKYAGGDEKLLKEISRYTSPKAALDALVASKQKIRSGELVKKPGKDATPEELAAWRESQGVPEKPDGYLEKLPKGLVIGEDDKEYIGSFAKDMHEIDAPPGFVHKAIDFYYKTRDAQIQAEYDANRDALEGTTDTLNAEYGQDYRRNMNLLEGALKGLPGEAFNAISNARGPDGIAILSNADVVRGLVQWAHQLNPVATLIPGASNPKAIDGRLAEIREMQTKEPKKYWSDAIQKEELKLLEAQQRLAKAG